MKILVTGGAGFIGSNLCALLLKKGHQVWAVDNFATGKPENLDFLKKDPNFTFFTCGVETTAFLEFCGNTSEKFDQVYHLACPTGVPNIEILGEEMMDACSQGTKNVLCIARDHGAKLIFTSSSEIYGNPKISPQSEEYTGNVDPLGWRANYEEGKRFSETWVKLFVSKYKVRASIVRLFNVYGPQMSLVDFRVVSRFMAQALTGKNLTVHGHGSQQRTLCFVDDLIEGLHLVMEKGQDGEVYNLGSDSAISMLDLAKKVLLISGSTSDIFFTSRAAHDPDGRMPVLDKVRALGWSPKVPLDRGLRMMMQNFQQRLPERESAVAVAKNIEIEYSPEL